MSTKSFAIVVSEFNQAITEKLLEGALARFKELNIAPASVHVTKVPGAVEIPLLAQVLIQQKKYDAIICLGAVIRGDTDHYDYVCQIVSDGCMQVMLKHNVPVIFGVLTTDNEEQALERVGGKHGHKGADAVDTALRMASLMENP